MAGYTYPVATGVYRKPPNLMSAPSSSEYQGTYLAPQRNALLADAESRAAGARLSAQNASPNDPALAAYGAVEGQLRGQSDASRGIMGILASYLQMKEGEQWQEYMLRLRAKLEEDAARKAAGNAIWGDVAGLAGGVAGAFIGGPAGASAGYGLGKKAAGTASDYSQGWG